MNIQEAWIRIAEAFESVYTEKGTHITFSDADISSRGLCYAVNRLEWNGDISGMTERKMKRQIDDYKAKINCYDFYLFPTKGTDYKDGICTYAEMSFDRQRRAVLARQFANEAL